jgi:hypothetical protein
MSPNPLPVLERSPDQLPDDAERRQTHGREHGVLKPNAYGLPHTEARSMSARSRNRPKKEKAPRKWGRSHVSAILGWLGDRGDRGSRPARLRCWSLSKR